MKGKTIGIMQPYFLPYLGYWQLLSAVDAFVVYDNIQYTKRGWINRNRFLSNGKATLFTIPLHKGSDFLDIGQRMLADDLDAAKILRQFEGSYRKAPFFNSVFPVLTDIVRYPERNLFDFIYNSIRAIAHFLGIATPILVSSDIAAEHWLHGQDRVLSICKSLAARTYINPIGGLELYSAEAFATEGIDLLFLRMKTNHYHQFGEPFVTNLSIVDVMMFNSLEATRRLLREFDLVLQPKEAAAVGTAQDPTAH